MPKGWQVSSAVLRCPAAYDALLTLERRHGYPREVTVEVDRRLSRFVERHSRQGKPPVMRPESERLVLRLAEKIGAQAMAVLANLAPDLDVASAGRLLGLPAAKITERAAYGH